MHVAPNRLPHKYLLQCCLSKVLFQSRSPSQRRTPNKWEYPNKALHTCVSLSGKSNFFFCSSKCYTLECKISMDVSSSFSQQLEDKYRSHVAWQQYKSMQYFETASSLSLATLCLIPQLAKSVGAAATH
eukprot:649953-Amphidinium_carterae.1